jgi:hypothetical protein
LEELVVAKEERNSAWAKRLESNHLQASRNLKLVVIISQASSCKTPVTDLTRRKEFPISYLPKVHRAKMAINQLTITISFKTLPVELLDIKITMVDSANWGQAPTISVEFWAQKQQRRVEKVKTMEC